VALLVSLAGVALLVSVEHLDGPVHLASVDTQDSVALLVSLAGVALLVSVEHLDGPVHQVSVDTQVSLALQVSVDTQVSAAGLAQVVSADGLAQVVSVATRDSQEHLVSLVGQALQVGQALPV